MQKASPANYGSQQMLHGGLKKEETGLLSEITKTTANHPVLSFLAQGPFLSPICKWIEIGLEKKIAPVSLDALESSVIKTFPMLNCTNC